MLYSGGALCLLRRPPGMPLSCRRPATMIALHTHADGMEMRDPDFLDRAWLAALPRGKHNALVRVQDTVELDLGPHNAPLHNANARHGLTFRPWPQGLAYSYIHISI